MIKQNIEIDKFMLESKSPKVLQLFKLAERAAASESNILIIGESGTGKEILASFIHNKSTKKTDDVKEINCQSLSESVLESELFGYDTEQGHIGIFETSNGGTLFLNEIGGLSISLQSKLLEVIENRAIYRVGGTAPTKVDFRLITATNRNLKEDIENGLFRKDLFYRINTIVLEMPPLRERKEDIPLFIDYFIDKYSKKMNKENIEMSSDIKKLLINYDYPGNIRELKNIIERVLVFSEHGEIIEEYLPSEVTDIKKTQNQESLFEIDYTESLKEYRSKAEKAYIESLLERYPDDMNRVAEVLAISRRQLFNKLVEFGLK